MISYFIFVEIQQFIGDPLEYIKSFWNYTDLLVNGLCLSVVVLDIMDFDSKMILRPIASSTLIIVWVKLFYYLRAYDSTSQLIRMIIETVKDIRYFLFVLFIGIVGFAGGFYILQYGLYGVGSDSDSNPQHLFVGTNPLLAIIYIYQLVMGNFNLGNFPEYDGTSQFEFYFIWFLFVVSCLFLVIVLMNLLIAIMSNTFSNVLAGIENLSIREKVLLLSENESLFDSTKVFKSAQFLIIIKEK
jgi:Ion transport protein